MSKNKIFHVGNVGINESDPQQQLHVHDDTTYHGILINGNAAPRVGFARQTTTTGEWSVGIDGTNGNNFAINNSNDNSNNKIVISSSQISLYGTVSVPNGNIVMGSTRGIDFSATGNGSGTMANELLDDYEEGSWTPDPHFATTGSAGETALVDGGLQGQYVKIGRLVYYTFSINFSGRSGSASGNFYVSGLPYNVSNTYWNEESGFPSAYYSGLTNSTGAPSTQPSHADKLYFAIPSSTGNHSSNTYLNHNDIGTGHIRIRGGGIYRTGT